MRQIASAAEYAKLGEKEGAKYILICSVPPFVRLSTLPWDVWSNIKHINAGIKDLCKNKGYNFCDVCTAMSLIDGTGDPKNFTDDGVHFSQNGNQACGETVANCIATVLNVESPL